MASSKDSVPSMGVIVGSVCVVQVFSFPLLLTLECFGLSLTGILAGLVGLLSLSLFGMLKCGTVDVQSLICSQPVFSSMLVHEVGLMAVGRPSFSCPSGGVAVKMLSITGFLFGHLPPLWIKEPSSVRVLVSSPETWGCVSAVICACVMDAISPVYVMFGVATFITFMQVRSHTSQSAAAPIASTPQSTSQPAQAEEEAGVANPGSSNQGVPTSTSTAKPSKEVTSFAPGAAKAEATSSTKASAKASSRVATATTSTTTATVRSSSSCVRSSSAASTKRTAKNSCAPTTGADCAPAKVGIGTENSAKTKGGTTLPLKTRVLQYQEDQKRRAKNPPPSEAPALLPEFTEAANDGGSCLFIDTKSQHPSPVSKSKSATHDNHPTVLSGKISPPRTDAHTASVSPRLSNSSSPPSPHDQPAESAAPTLSVKTQGSSATPETTINKSPVFVPPPAQAEHSAAAETELSEVLRWFSPPEEAAEPNPHTVRVPRGSALSRRTNVPKDVSFQSVNRQLKQRIQPTNQAKARQNVPLPPGSDRPCSNLPIVVLPNEQSASGDGDVFSADGVEALGGSNSGTGSGSGSGSLAGPSLRSLSPTGRAVSPGTLLTSGSGGTKARKGHSLSQPVSACHSVESVINVGASGQDLDELSLERELSIESVVRASGYETVRAGDMGASSSDHGSSQDTDSLDSPMGSVTREELCGGTGNDSEAEREEHRGTPQQEGSCPDNAVRDEHESSIPRIEQGSASPVLGLQEARARAGSLRSSLCGDIESCSPDVVEQCGSQGSLGGTAAVAAMDQSANQEGLDGTSVDGTNAFQSAYRPESETRLPCGNEKETRLSPPAVQPPLENKSPESKLRAQLRIHYTDLGGGDASDDNDESARSDDTVPQPGKQIYLRQLQRQLQSQVVSQFRSGDAWEYRSATPQSIREDDVFSLGTMSDMSSRDPFTDDHETVDIDIDADDTTIASSLSPSLSPSPPIATTPPLTGMLDAVPNSAVQTTLEVSPAKKPPRHPSNADHSADASWEQQKLDLVRKERMLIQLELEEQRLLAEQRQRTSQRAKSARARLDFVGLNALPPASTREEAKDPNGPLERSYDDVPPSDTQTSSAETLPALSSNPSFEALPTRPVELISKAVEVMPQPAEVISKPVGVIPKPTQAIPEPALGSATPQPDTHEEEGIDGSSLSAVVGPMEHLKLVGAELDSDQMSNDSLECEETSPQRAAVLVNLTEPVSAQQSAKRAKFLEEREQRQKAAAERRQASKSVPHKPLRRLLTAPKRVLEVKSADCVPALRKPLKTFEHNALAPLASTRPRSSSVTDVPLGARAAPTSVLLPSRPSPLLRSDRSLPQQSPTFASSARAGARPTTSRGLPSSPAGGGARGPGLRPTLAARPASPPTSLSARPAAAKPVRPSSPPPTSTLIKRTSSPPLRASSPISTLPKRTSSPPPPVSSRGTASPPATRARSPVGAHSISTGAARRPPDSSATSPAGRRPTSPATSPVTSPLPARRPTSPSAHRPKSPPTRLTAQVPTRGAVSPENSVTSIRPTSPLRVPLQRRSNRKIVRLALHQFCLASPAAQRDCEAACSALDACPGDNFIILFRRQLSLVFRGLYAFDPVACLAQQFYGVGPATLEARMVESFLKYNSGAKDFSPLGVLSLSVAVDAVCVHDAWFPRKKPSKSNSQSEQS